MSYQQKDNTGTLFKNDRREKDSHPNAKGTAVIDGVEYWVSAWTKSGSKGPFQSLSFQKKEVGTKATKQKTFHEELDDELPPF